MRPYRGGVRDSKRGRGLWEGGLLVPKPRECQEMAFFQHCRAVRRLIVVLLVWRDSHALPRIVTSQQNMFTITHTQVLEMEGRVPRHELPD